MDYLMFNICTEVTIIDIPNKMIVDLKCGNFTDITKECQKQYEKELNKPVHKNGKKLGGLYYEIMLGNIDRKSAVVWDKDVIIETNDRTEFDKKVLEEQANEHNLQYIIAKKQLERLNNNGQYFTYTFRERM